MTTYHKYGRNMKGCCIVMLDVRLESAAFSQLNRRVHYCEIAACVSSHFAH